MTTAPREGLRTAVLCGDVAEVMALCKEGTDVNRAMRGCGKSLFQLACRAGKAEVVRVLLDSLRGNLISADSMGRQPLHLAVESGDTTTATLLLERLNAKRWTKRVLSMPDDRGCTPVALGCSNPAMLRLLLAEVGEEGETLLCRTPDSALGLLQRAVLHRSEQCVEMLLGTSVAPSLLEDVDSKGRTALIASCSEGEEEIAMRLVEAKADVTCIDTSGQNALHWAYEMGHYKLAERLIDAYPEMGEVVDTRGRTPADCAIWVGNAEAQTCKEISSLAGNTGGATTLPLAELAALTPPAPPTGVSLQQDAEALAEALARDVEALELAVDEAQSRLRSANDDEEVNSLEIQLRGLLDASDMFEEHLIKSEEETEEEAAVVLGLGTLVSSDITKKPSSCAVLEKPRPTLVDACCGD